MDAEKEAKRLREIAREHKRKMETDPEYRKEYEEFQKQMEPMLKYLGNDTDD